MNILVRRIARKDHYTIGKLYIDGAYFCDTLEDKDRGLRQDMPLAEIKRKKVYGETAIPTGKYTVGVHFWTKHKVWCAHILNVPGYDGILIHNGTNESHTLGCLLVGENRVVGQLTNGKKYMAEIYQMVKAVRDNGGVVTIEIV